MPNAHNITRVGELHEYKAGHYYVSRIDWEDGHTEIEVHRCQPQLLFHSCDPKEWDAACSQADKLAEGERQDVRLIGAKEA